MRTYKVLISIFTMFIIFLISFNNSHAKNGSEIFEEIIKCTNSHIEEYEMCVEIKSNNEDVFKDILNYIYKCRFIQTRNKTNINIYEFKKNNMYLYIESIKNGNNSIVKIKIKEKGRDKEILNIKKDIKDILYKKNINATYCECVKAKTENSIEDINKMVLDLINKNGFKNIETVKIYNGYSTVASTGNLKDTNFNCAVCKYSSGNYILIGIPQINISY
ncbi:hypothetical protein CLOACE_21570 [Clostridium acetireducens DSM 10703]|uniref:TATA-box binding protein n=1 Tax=Clostridium acetireducens DSM 10703 TaxID=1121290 RepID=A0A1E8EVX4_9CLOT|nr:hypothetical protein [Clostridium acetireducens]OFI01405.1 hypothetical protein CLOACE_21570 [Clostridium acetireducens DSM 10703]